MKRDISTLLVIIKILLGIGLLVYLSLSGAIDWKMLQGLTRAWDKTLAAFSLLFVGLGMTGWRLCLLMRPSGFYLSVWSSMKLTLIGTFFNICLPGATGGDAVRIYYAIGGNQGRRMEVATILLFDRIIGLFALLILPLLMAPLYPEQIMEFGILGGLLWSALALAVIIFGVVMLSIFIDIREWFILLWILRKGPIGVYLGRIIETIRVYRRTPLTLLAATGMSLVIHTITIGVILVIIHTVNAEEFSWLMCIVIPIGLLANALPLTPGGLGVGEAAFDILFRSLNLTGGAEALLGWRLLMVAAGLLGLLFYLRAKERFVHSSLPLEKPSS
jgi:uncharacterized protein (TIRG00374 family)